MTYNLCLGDRAYSSWSLRGWLLFEAFGLSARITLAPLYDPKFQETLSSFFPARTVPALRLDDGLVIGDSLAMAEELASRHPEAGHWPKDPKARAIARTLAAEMHSSFTALRGHCPMNLRVSYDTCEPPQPVLDDLARLEAIWAWARKETGSSGPWLCGDYCAADAFFAPVAARIAGYNLPVSDDAQRYVKAHLGHGPFRRWRAMGLVSGPHQPFYDRDWPQRDWPFSSTVTAHACDGPSINQTCPFSNKPVTHFMRCKDRVLGFCNAFCRDKAMVDPLAWPEVVSLLEA